MSLFLSAFIATLATGGWFLGFGGWADWMPAYLIALFLGFYVVFRGVFAAQTGKRLITALWCALGGCVVGAVAYLAALLSAGGLWSEMANNALMPTQVLMFSAAPAGIAALVIGQLRQMRPAT